MGFKQPRVPEYQQGESVETYIRTLILFLKDFCQEAWTENRVQRKAIGGISYPVTSVNMKTGDVNLLTSDIAYLGTNRIESDEDDTTQTWRSIGSGYAWFDSESKWTLKPSTWGLLLNVSYGAEIFQIWNTQSGGVTYFRSGNASGWSNGWRKVYDSTYKPTVLEIGAYPIGSIYMSVKSTSPASMFGGTWEQIRDRFLLAAGGNYAEGATGGAATVTLTTNQIPAHDHKMWIYTGDSGSISVPIWDVYAAERWTNTGMFRTTSTGETGKARNSSLGDTGSVGGSAAHNNMPPYLAVYMWKRVS